MSQHVKSVVIIGIIIPVVITLAILAGSLTGFFRIHRTLKKNFKIYTAINECKKQLQESSQEAQFLEAQMLTLEDVRQINDLVTSLEKGIKSEKGSQWLGVESPSEDRRVFSIEGLSGPTIPIIGIAMKKSPTVLIESWEIKKNKGGKRLSIHIKTVLPNTEHSE